MEEQLVCVYAEEDMIATTSSVTPYVEIDEKVMECSFRSLEFVTAMYVKEGAKIPVPKLSEVTHSSIRQVPGKGARVEKGLGKRLQGMLKLIATIQKKDRFGLGYKPDRKERQRFMEEKRQSRIANFLKKEKDSARMNIPPLSSSFLSAGFINLDMIQGSDEKVMVNVAKIFGSLNIDMVEFEDQKARSTGLPPFPRGQFLDNWTAVELPVVFKLSNE